MVNPIIIQWAIDWNGLTTDDFIKTFPKIEQWIDGSHEPTFKQLEKFATKTHTIVPYFFMKDIPDVHLQIADFRTVNPAEKSIPSPELFDTIDELLYKQAWLRDYFIDEGVEKLEWVGTYKNRLPLPDASVMADHLHSILRLDKDWASASSINSTDAAWRVLRKAIEASRVAVCISGYAGTNTRRTFSVSEFRGFALSDQYAPLVFVNGADAKTAQLFTLVHEMAHILFFQTGVSSPIDLSESLGSETEIEKYCDQVAVEFLVPKDSFLALWTGMNNKEAPIKASLHKYKVSTIVILRRALDLELITQAEFWELYDIHYGNKENARTSKPSGGDYYKTQGTKLGNVFTDAIYTALKTGYLQFADAYKMTGFKSESLDRYYRERGMVL